MLIFFIKHEISKAFGKEENMRKKKRDKKKKNIKTVFFAKASDRCVLESDDGHRRNETPL